MQELKKEKEISHIERESMWYLGLSLPLFLFNKWKHVEKKSYLLFFWGCAQMIDNIPTEDCDLDQKQQVRFSILQMTVNVFRNSHFFYFLIILHLEAEFILCGSL